MTEILTIQQVEQEAARRGVVLDASDYEIAQQAMDARRAQIEAQSATEATTWADRFNEFFPRLLRALHAIGDTSITIVQTLLVGPGVGVILLFLLVVEGQRVYYGLSLFETHPALAGFGALALVLLNLALELLIHFVEHKAEWIEPPQYRASLALWARRLAYWLGRGEWSPAQKSPAIRFRYVLRVVTITILALALAGSMQSVLSKTGGAWNTAIAKIITQSTLLELFTWAGGLLFAFAAVISAQALSRYAGAKAVEVAVILASGAPDRAAVALEAVGASGAAALLARMKEKQSARRLSAAAPLSVAATEIAEPVSAVSGQAETAQRADASPSASGVSETRITITPAVARAIAWLSAHPEHSALSLRDQAALAGLSAATMQRARKARPTQ